MHAGDYDLIIRNKNLRKTIYIEQNLKQDTSVLKQGNRTSGYGELQANYELHLGLQGHHTIKGSYRIFSDSIVNLAQLGRARHYREK